MIKKTIVLFLLFLFVNIFNNSKLRHISPVVVSELKLDQHDSIYGQ